MRPQSGSVTKIWKKVSASIELELEMDRPNDPISVHRVREAIENHATFTVIHVATEDTAAFSDVEQIATWLDGLAASALGLVNLEDQPQHARESAAERVHLYRSIAGRVRDGVWRRK